MNIELFHHYLPVNEDNLFTAADQSLTIFEYSGPVISIDNAFLYAIDCSIESVCPYMLKLINKIMIDTIIVLIFIVLIGILLNS